MLNESPSIQRIFLVKLVCYINDNMIIKSGLNCLNFKSIKVLKISNQTKLEQKV